MGIELPAVVPAGPDNPMGHHAIRLAAYGGVYLLHGTNADFGIGMRVSSGCIRLRDNDIKALYNTISPGTKVNIINTPIKASVEPDGRRLVEVHQPLSEHIDDDPQTLPITLNAAMTAFKQAPQTDGTVMERAMNYRSGMPIDVTRHADPDRSRCSLIAQQNPPDGGFCWQGSNRGTTGSYSSPSGEGAGHDASGLLVDNGGTVKGIRTGYRSNTV